MAWEALDKDDKAEILSLFPDNQHVLAIGSEDARPDLVSLMNDDSFRHDCAAYVENIAQGRHDVEWLASAWAAHERRKAGDFDEYLENKFEEEWGIELPPEMKTNRGGLFTNGGPAGSQAVDEIVVMTDVTKETNGYDDQDDTQGMNGINEDTREINGINGDTQVMNDIDGGANAEEVKDGINGLNGVNGTHAETSRDDEPMEIPQQIKDEQSSKGKDLPDVPVLPAEEPQQQSTKMEIDGTNFTNGSA